jgi:hypothetical protein
MPKVLHSLSNEKLDVHFCEPGGLCAIGFKGEGMIALSQDNFNFTLDGTAVNSRLLPPPAIQAPSNESVLFQYRVSGSLSIQVEYTLKAGWSFVTKQLFISATNTSAVRKLGSVAPFDSIVVSNTSELATAATPRGAGDWAMFLRFGGSKTGLFTLIQTMSTNLSVSRTPFGTTVLGGAYAADMPIPSPHDADRAVLGLYKSSGLKVNFPLAWYQTVFYDALGGSADLDTAERDAFIDCAAAFFVDPPKTRTFKVNVAWCENDYQVDMANETQAAEYYRIFDMLSKLGVDRITYAPQNTAVSSRSQATDGWKWEEALWFGMGIDIREKKWIPGRDKLPRTVLDPLTYAHNKGVYPQPYIYPMLGFEAVSADNRGQFARDELQACTLALMSTYA